MAKAPFADGLNQYFPLMDSREEETSIHFLGNEGVAIYDINPNRERKDFRIKTC